MVESNTKQCITCFNDIDDLRGAGCGVQTGIPSTEGRLNRLRQMLSEAKKDILTGVDGGITRDNITDVARMNVDIIVTGSAVFDDKTPLENAKFMIDAVNDVTGK